MNADTYSCADLRYTFSKHPHIYLHQQLNFHEFESLSPDFEEDELSDNQSFERLQAQPYLGNHYHLVHKIEKRLYKMSHGDSRICVQCKKKVYWYESHDICLSPQESAETVASNSSRRMSDLIDVSVIEDPGKLHSLRSRLPQQIIQQNPLLWSPFVVQMHLNMIEYLINMKSEELLNCRYDKDWSNLSMPSGLFVSSIDHALTKQMRKLQKRQDVCIADLGNDCKHVFESLCGIFCIKRFELDELEDLNQLEFTRSRQIDNAAYIVNVYLSTHQLIDDVCSRKEFIEFCMNHFRSMLPDEHWSFESL